MARLEYLPPELKNTSGEDCMLSCVGMALRDLGVAQLTLEEIKAEVEIPGEEDVPFHRLFSWLGNMGVRSVWIEGMQDNLPLQAELSQCDRASFTLHPKPAQLQDVIDGISSGWALIWQVASDFEAPEPDHAVYIANTYTGKYSNSRSALILDPDIGAFGLEMDDLMKVYPNLVALRSS